jgi:hypothetical protein
VLYGAPQSGFPLYAPSTQRWVPAAMHQTTRDGASYAYAVEGEIGSGRSSVRVVDVAQATERVFTVESPAEPWAGGRHPAVHIDAFEGSDVFFSYPRMEAYPESIWRLNVLTGTIRAVSKVSGVMAVRSGYAWFGRVDPRDPSPPSYQRGGEFFNSISRLDLATGSETLWYYAPGESVVVRGFDEGDRPVVSRDPTIAGTQDFRLIKSPGDKGTTIYAGSTLSLFDLVADAGSLWFGSYRGIYLWTATTGLRKVFGFTSSHQTGAIYPAGRCFKP